MFSPPRPSPPASRDLDRRQAALDAARLASLAAVTDQLTARVRSIEDGLEQSWEQDRERFATIHAALFNAGQGTEALRRSVSGMDERVNSLEQRSAVAERGTQAPAPAPAPNHAPAPAPSPPPAPATALPPAPARARRMRRPRGSGAGAAIVAVYGVDGHIEQWKSLDEMDIADLEAIYYHSRGIQRHRRMLPEYGGYCFQGSRAPHVPTPGGRKKC